MSNPILSELIELAGGSLHVHDSHVHVTDEPAFRTNIEKLVRVSALGTGAKQWAARWLVRAAAQDLGILPASIHQLYIARGAGDVPTTFTVPAMNLRVLSYDAARMIFKVAMSINAAAILFEIARSEIGYTEQRPAEYTTNVLGAAIAQGYRGPVFIQGDHFQISASRYKSDPDSEVQTVKDLTKEAIEAGFFNIDVDTSTLVDLEKETIPEQQDTNTSLSAELTAFIRSIQPDGVTISVGGEIGEVGGRNSTEEELRAYTEGYNAKLPGGMDGLSKISIQTGTSHGGVVLPDGSIAQVAVDFDTMLKLSRVARMEYGMAGAVQHGASTLPQDAFGKFVEAEACEVHLATNFQNIFYDLAPEGLVKEIYAYLDENAANERKPDQTDDQFYYSSRKRAIGAFKKRIWDLPQEDKEKIFKEWEVQFQHLFNALAIADTRKYVEEHVTPVNTLPVLEDYLKASGEEMGEEDVSDLSD